METDLGTPVGVEPPTIAAANHWAAPTLAPGTTAGLLIVLDPLFYPGRTEDWSTVGLGWALLHLVPSMVAAPTPVLLLCVVWSL